ncbi:VanZ family protein [Stenotrophomonas koreensis]|nr:VanZ family protein [Stenotrophomonas koreensis]
MLSDILLALLVLGAGAFFAYRASPVAQAVLFGSAMLASGLLFLPGEQITGLVGAEGIGWLRRWAAHTPFDISQWTHFLIFAWLGLLLWLGRVDLRGWKAWAMVAVLAIAAELAQGLAPGRAPRLDDVVTNLVGGVTGLLLGSALGVLLASMLQRLRPRLGKQSDAER